MKLCLSNFAWDESRNDEIYWFMQDRGIEGLEIAPTKLFGENPYGMIPKAKEYFVELKQDYSIVVASMQSIWYRRNERIFGRDAEREFLLEYTKKALDFAAAIGCGNLVFGSPKNRSMEEGDNIETAVSFFREIGEYAAQNGGKLALEANPAMYGTNFLNTTREALDFCKIVDSDGIRVNLDFGTIIENGEILDFTKDDIDLINHVHISEPHLKPVVKREAHRELRAILEENGYEGYVSIEMGESDNEMDILDAAVYLKEVFG